MNSAVYRHLLQTYGRKPGLWLGFCAEIVRTLLLRVYVTVIMSQVVADIASGKFADAKRESLYFFIAYAIGAIIGACGDIISVKNENNQYDEQIGKIYRKLTGKDMSFYRDHQTGYLVSAFRQYLDGTILFVRFLRGEALRTTISLIVPAIVLFVANWQVGLVAILVIIIQILYVTWSSKKINAYRAFAHEVYRKLTAEVSDEITNIVAFKSGGKEQEGYSHVVELGHQETGIYWRRRISPILFDLPRSIFTTAGVTVAFYCVINSYTDTASSIALMVLTITYMFQIIRTVAEIPELMTQHDEYITKIHPILEYFSNRYETIRNPDEPKKCTIKQGEIILNSVSFRYTSQSGAQHAQIFDRLSVTIKAGQQVGVVGLSGAGKSTLANLLMRFDDVVEGSIRIDGIDIREIRQEELRQRIAYVPQEPLLFHRTVRENIAYFCPNASLAQVKQAAQAAHAHEFIMTFPDGYETIVGERGIKLSGGQKQRIAIARAVLKNAPIMIFDEATSALDSESEQIIQKALPTILGKQTALIIAHRLSTIAGLDRIIVMHNGTIVEDGKHEDLLILGGRYAKLWKKQTREEVL